MGQVKEPQERHFYMLAAITGKWSSRELERQVAPAPRVGAKPEEKKCQQP